MKSCSAQNINKFNNLSAWIGLALLLSLLFVVLILDMSLGLNSVHIKHVWLLCFNIFCSSNQMLLHQILSTLKKSLFYAEQWRLSWILCKVLGKLVCFIVGEHLFLSTKTQQFILLSQLFDGDFFRSLEDDGKESSEKLKWTFRKVRFRVDPIKLNFITFIGFGPWDFLLTIILSFKDRCDTLF